MFNIKYVSLEYKLSRVNGQFLPQPSLSKSSAKRRFCLQVVYLGIGSHGAGMTDKGIQYNLLKRLKNVF